MAAEVLVTEEFADWYAALEEEVAFRITVTIGLLEERGVALGFPHSSAIKGNNLPMRELRTQIQGRPYRVFYVFDPQRSIVLLLGGDKTGDDRFYERMVPLAEAAYRKYEKEIEK